jgi:hypothetical protein
MMTKIVNERRDVTTTLNEHFHAKKLDDLDEMDIRPLEMTPKK